MDMYFRFLKYLKPYFIQLVGVVICLIMVSLGNVVVIPLVGKLTEAIGAKNFTLLNLVILAAVLAYFIKGIFMYGQVYLSAFVGQGIVRDVRSEMFRHMQTLSLDFFNKWRTGDLMSRVLSDIGQMQEATVSSATEIIPSLITLLSVIGYLVFLNWKLTLLSMVMLPVLFYTMSKIGREMRRISKKQRIKSADIASILQENITGVRVVKSFTMEEKETEKFVRESDASFWIAMREAAIHATSTPILTFIQSLAILGVVWYGAFQVVSGALAASSLIAFFTGIALLADPVSKLSKMNITIQRALSSAERIFEISDIKPTVKEKPGAVVLSKVSGAVEFKEVSFAYERTDNNALEGISVKIKPGEIIALVGPSGAGKSTFINLIARFYDATKGSILVDGVDIRDVQLYSLRSQMGMVPQETMLFLGTIMENIAYGKPNASKEEILSAAKAANAHEFIVSMPHGYDTFVGERGVRLSGGQKQRVAIARALLRDPRILILDEATSSLDTESERLVQDALEKLMKGRTTFVIAHRLSTVQIANRVLVFKEGRIVEQGTHKELMEEGGLYKKLYEMQFRNKPA